MSRILNISSLLVYVDQKPDNTIGGTLRRSQVPQQAMPKEDRQAIKNDCRDSKPLPPPRTAGLSEIDIELLVGEVISDGELEEAMK